ncbi:response regulator [Candidatus Poriferisodalis sp.]|uniref:response regulator n=1 Tax=Candidatus Poriferisodalis sp. TaxID=3101277 RepID=UPI003C6EF80B
MDWGSVPPLLTVVLASLVALAGAMWAVLKVIRVELAERFDARFDAVDSRFEALIARFDARFDAVDSRFDAVDSRFDAVDSRFDAVDSRFDALDKRVDGVDRRFDELWVDLRALTERVDRIVEGIPPLQPA